MTFIDEVTARYEVEAAGKKDPQKIVESLVKSDGLRFIDGYSGRGMFGKQSQLAFAVPHRLADKEKKAVEKKLGVYLSSDSLGLDFVYYVS